MFQKVERNLGIKKKIEVKLPEIKRKKPEKPVNPKP